jgi:hypothetical protein
MSVYEIILFLRNNLSNSGIIAGLVILIVVLAIVGLFKSAGRTK